MLKAAYARKATSSKNPDFLKFRTQRAVNKHAWSQAVLFNPIHFLFAMICANRYVYLYIYTDTDVQAHSNTYCKALVVIFC